jgi:hypothetical protein
VGAHRRRTLTPRRKASAAGRPWATAWGCPWRCTCPSRSSWRGACRCCCP